MFIAKTNTEEVLHNNLIKCENRAESLEKALIDLVYSCDNNSGFEPSLSLYQRELDEAKKLINQKFER